MNREKAIKYIRDISFLIGTMGVEHLSDKDGQRMRECLDFLCDDIDNLENLIDKKLGMWTKGRKCGMSLVEMMEVLEKARKYDEMMLEKNIESK